MVSNRGLLINGLAGRSPDRISHTILSISFVLGVSIFWDNWERNLMIVWIRRTTVYESKSDASGDSGKTSSRGRPKARSDRAGNETVEG